MALLPRRLSSCVLPFRHAVRRSLRRCFDGAGAGAEAAVLGGGRRLTWRGGEQPLKGPWAESEFNFRPYLNLFGIKQTSSIFMAGGLVISKMHVGPLFSFVQMYLTQHVKLQPCKKPTLGCCAHGVCHGVCENKDMYHVTICNPQGEKHLAPQDIDG
jgi:hypothetical protein